MCVRFNVKEGERNVSGFLDYDDFNTEAYNFYVRCYALILRSRLGLVTRLTEALQMEPMAFHPAPFTDENERGFDLLRPLCIYFSRTWDFYRGSQLLLSWAPTQT